MTTSLIQPPLPTSPKQRRFWTTPDGASMALAVVDAARAHDGLVVVAVRDNLRAHQLEQELEVFAGDLPVLHFPDWETLPYDLFSPHPEIVSRRIATLYRLPTATRGVLVVPVFTLMQRLAPRSYVAGSGLSIRVGQTLTIADEQQRMEAAGYRHVPQVGDPGEFAVRGALIDIFPMGATEPYRIELFDEEIESIRSFDPETQLSAHKVESVELLPAREFPLTDHATRDFRNRLRERFPIDVRRCPVYQDIKQGVAPGGIEYFLPLFFETTETLFDYLAENALFVLGERAMESADAFWTQVGERHEQRAHDIERPILSPEDLYLPPEHLREQLNLQLRVELVDKDHKHAQSLGTQPAPNLPLNHRGEEAGAALRHFLDAYPGRVLIATDSAGRREALYDQLGALGIHPQPTDSWRSFADAEGTDAPKLAITVAELEQGFALTKPALTVLTERELLGERVRQERRGRRTATRDPDTIIRDLTELEIGSPIVHLDHGVGRYRGLTSLDVGDTANEFLVIEYAKEAKLYVPVAQLGLVSRYTGTAPELAPLHSLGGDAWEKARKKAAEKVRDVAAELLAIYAQREARKGAAMPIDRVMYADFAANFPFEETPDQRNAIEAVLNDLAAPKPMDRVVCGDVGFGKTEVALRAAFVTAAAGRQVAVLVPTTLLAQQHYQNFADRFADWPMRVEVLSRFRAKKDVDAALQGIADGKVDIIIGTHKLLQKDVKFKDLGLVIVDEEQRFGVRQKEALKKLRAEVDLLTLTATPIPRTLNMSMNGLRDLSIIATPPAHRMAVKTLISEYDPAMVREAVQRELARGGQIYFLHNNVDTIERTARELEELLPDARVRVAHGQMPERELEQVMLDFHRQRFHILVCTTIIETGIDIPTANTIVIDRADRFGLAQLHQLRGRVGRSHHRAYAYLIVPDRKAISADAAKRLEALASLEELGAGFTLATHDLEIRGAGELLGDEQSGQIQQIGFGLYTELLERAVKALRSGKVPDFDLTSDHEAEVELHLPALIPDDYLPDVHTRLTLYKRIASARDSDALRELQVEMVDRFGLLPDAVKQLFAVTELKLRATPMGIRKLEFGPAGGRILFHENPEIDPMAIIRLIQGQPRVYKLDGQDKLRVTLELPGAAERLRTAHDLLNTLGARKAA
ncbi:transcription-repair coupling factor [Oleiagrimonas soli]|uniref:Transcription-repair-coupling factor n=1 Tax=Oleiagrimonas soli TaxID=1543381 RepID=A0A099CW15_9GAMM|nr:transcription-repair coupling factor [Oleiagrimonas soli]KGI77861.1 transcription-repair coupling factor [Oleiagrimonas soli]MBB6183793.1 transcription-repair coupling factor (superfamily II helicase) [Oleiagrimonas soli]